MRRTIDELANVTQYTPLNGDEEAVPDQLIGHNPAAGIKPPKAPVRRDVHLSDEDVRSIIDAAPQQHHGLVVLLVGLGLRVSEACGLRVEDVDLLRKTVRVRQQRRPDGTFGKLKASTSSRCPGGWAAAC